MYLMNLKFLLRCTTGIQVNEFSISETKNPKSLIKNPCRNDKNSR